MRRCLQSATYVFVVCLAVSDLALCLFSLPVQLHYQLTNNWYFGNTLCRVVFAAFAVPMYLSTVTIMLIAIDRCAMMHYQPTISAPPDCIQDGPKTGTLFGTP